jgi:hypothetical protein
VVNPGQELNLGSELQVSLQGSLLGSLDSNQLPSGKCPSVNLQIPTKALNIYQFWKCMKLNACHAG